MGWESFLVSGESFEEVEGGMLKRDGVWGWVVIGENDTDWGACTGLGDSDDLLEVLDGDKVEDALESRDDFEFEDVTKENFALIKSNYWLNNWSALPSPPAQSSPRAGG